MIADIKESTFYISNIKTANLNNNLFLELYKIEKRIKNSINKNILLKKRDEIVENIIKKNSGLIGNQIKKFNKYYSKDIMSQEDLYSEGMFGLIAAINKFDINKGIQFSTFASSYIWGYMMRYISTTSFINIPSHRLFDKTSQEDLPVGFICIDDFENTKEILDIPSTNLKTSTDILDNMFIEDILTSLSEEEKNIFIDVYYNNLTFAEISRKLGIQAHIIRGKYLDAIENIKIYLFKNNIDFFISNLDRIDKKYDIKNILENRSDLSPYKEGHIADYIFSILIKYKDGILLTDIVEIINFYMQKNCSTRIRHIINSWINEDSPLGFKVSSNIDNKKGRPRTQDENNRVIKLELDKEIMPLWNFNNLNINMENILKKESKFRKNSVSHLVYLIINYCGATGITFYDLNYLCNKHFPKYSRKKLIRLLYKWRKNQKVDDKIFILTCDKISDSTIVKLI